MNNKLITIVVIIALILVGYFIFRDKSLAPTEDSITNEVPVSGSNVAETVVVENAPEVNTGVVKEFTVDAVSFSFTPAKMEVNKGDTVKITVKNNGGTHDFKIDELGASTRLLQTGESETISFIADKAGSFEYYCSVGNHRALGMVGTFIVK